MAIRLRERNVFIRYSRVKPVVLIHLMNTSERSLSLVYERRIYERYEMKSTVTTKSPHVERKYLNQDDRGSSMKLTIKIVSDLLTL